MFTVVCPLKQKETDCKPTFRYNQTKHVLTATSSYLTSVSYYHNESKLNIQDQFIANLKSYNGSNLLILKPFISTVPFFTKTDISAVLKDIKEIPMRHLILPSHKSRKSGQFLPRWTYLPNSIPTVTILWVGIIALHLMYEKICKDLQVSQKQR